MLGQLTNEEIEEVLMNNLLGRIGCSNGKKVYVVPVNYVYDGHYIFAQSQEGLKIDMMRNNPNVCFEVDEVKDFINWQSVILWGVYQELFDERSRYDVMKSFNEKMLHIKIKLRLIRRKHYKVILIVLTIQAQNLLYTVSLLTKGLADLRKNRKRFPQLF